jgi:CRP-like cAMP-binding protein
VRRRHRELRNIAPALHHRSYLEGEIIFDEGEAGEAVFFVLDGTVTLRRMLGDGHRVQTQVEKGDLFGVVALLVGGTNLSDRSRCFSPVSAASSSPRWLRCRSGCQH